MKHTPNEPTGHGVILMVRHTGGNAYFMERKRNRAWGPVNERDGTFHWSELWGDAFTDQRILGTFPDHLEHSTHFEYGHRANEEGERTFCPSRDWEPDIAATHEAWRTVTTYQGGHVVRSPWLPLPLDSEE